MSPKREVQDVSSGPHVFILGVERSGSTWLSNIFDSSEETLFFMEPFASFNKVFEGFPGRLLHASQADPFLKEVIQEGFEKLYACKYPLFDYHGAASWERRLTYQVLQAHASIARTLRMPPPIPYTRYQQINLNRLKNPALPQQKAEAFEKVVTKEVRLNFKVKLIAEVFEGSKFIVIIRNPLSQVHSILKLIDRGSLPQLRQSLYAFNDYSRSNGRFDKYRKVEAFAGDRSLLERAVNYWFVNYNTLIEDLEATGADYRVVRHEELSEEPVALARELFSFVGVEFGEATKRYIQRSTTGKKEVASPVDTTRSSRAYYARALENARESLPESFFSLAGKFWKVSHPVVRRYEPLLTSRGAC